MSSHKPSRVEFYYLPGEGFVRLKQIIGDPKADPPTPPIIPVSRATWWDGVNNGRFPSPVKPFGANITLWHVEEIRALYESSQRDKSDMKDETYEEVETNEDIGQDSDIKFDEHTVTDENTETEEDPEPD